jgi:phage FluMu protein Com
VGDSLKRSVLRFRFDRNHSLMKHIRCEKCGADVLIPNVVAEIRQSVSETARRVGRIEAIIELRELVDLDLSGAKALVSHLSDAGLSCHRCHRELIEDDNQEVTCPRCRSLNLKW